MFNHCTRRVLFPFSFPVSRCCCFSVLLLFASNSSFFCSSSCSQQPNSRTSSLPQYVNGFQRMPFSFFFIFHCLNQGERATVEQRLFGVDGRGGRERLGELRSALCEPTKEDMRTAREARAAVV
ncbi:hypothetical protein ABB37_04854 [Leptomonas pyrrhocoris]|uniref:Secreted protein n=1 Tax=Leptomonas pyrrhocoris TaxID=157538 RepID=A0A0M9G235_LEPPY|nr:hypothetical protein ABB37_04854 [Leptomonas pyrrhocoris]KPA80673.1 hypothetical protein ABB37_04854 [Leptomonas pyrrhocoris]|eukprot:XP_015659112.1 hypothetical protein ABB37_04854 [Leptomonas pyrrhocoris]